MSVGNASQKDCFISNELNDILGGLQHVEKTLTHGDFSHSPTFHLECCNWFGLHYARSR
jgi:hypothetical protein